MDKRHQQYRVGGSESPVPEGRGRFRTQARFPPPDVRHVSRSCHDLPGTLIYSRSSGNVPSMFSRLDPEQGRNRTHLPAPLVSMGYDPGPAKGNLNNPRKPVTATVSAPRQVLPSYQPRHSSPLSCTAAQPRHSSPLSRTAAVQALRKNAISNGGCLENRHTTLGTQLSWSPTRQGQQQQASYRARVSSDSHGEQNKRLSRSVRIKNWIQNKQNSGSLDDTQNTFYSMDEADDDGRPCSNYHLHDIHEEAERHLKKPGKRTTRRISKVSRRKREWRADVDHDISPESEACENDIEEATNFEKRLLEVSSGWNPQEVREQRINALRSFLSTKQQPLTVLNLLEAGKIAEAVAMARESNMRLKLDICLLWACLQGAADLVHSLLEAGACADTKDSAGFSAMHLAAESGSDEVIKVLIKGGAKVGTSAEWDYNQEFTPLMLAARSGCINGIKALISAGADVNAGLNSDKETPLHHAVHSAVPECVQILLKAGANPNPTIMFSETPLHVAVYEGLLDIVDILLNAGADVRSSRGASKMTALHIAAYEGYSSIAHQLLKAGADPNQENLKQQTPLHLAAKAQSYDSVQVLLSFGADPNARDRDRKTPLHSGIFKGSRSHECLRLLLEAGADTNAADLSGYTPLHMAAVHDSTYCVLLFLDHGGDVTACTQGGVSALNLILRRTPTVLAHIQENLDAAIGFTDHDHHDRESQVQMNFRVLIPGEGYGLECRMLSCFIREGQKALLKHPLCETLLFLKWLKVRNFFIFNLIFYALMVAMLTVYIIVVFPAASCFHLNSTTQETIFAPFHFSPPSPTEHQDSTLTPTLPDVDTTPPDPMAYNSTPPTDYQTTTHMMSKENAQRREECGMKYESLLASLLYVIWAFISMLAIKELFQIIDTPRTYFSSWENLLEWPIITFTMLITVTSYVKQDTEPWEHHLAAVVILITWVKLLLLIGRFPVFGLYVLMFTQVTKNFGKFLFAYLSLINAFSLSFGVLFPNHEPFKVYMLRLVKTIVMMTGEIEYDEWFFDDKKTIMYPITSHIIFSVFLIFVTIILMNLLVGLAVSDIQGLQKSAGLDRLVRETQQISHFEAIMFSKWLPLVIPKSLLTLLYKGILICPSLYGYTLVLTPQTLIDTGLPPELVEVILRTARARDHVARRRHAFANFRSLSKTAQYSGDDGDVQKSIDALRFGLDLLVWDADERRDDGIFLKKALSNLAEDIATINTQVSTLVSSGTCHKCEQELEGEKEEDNRRSLYTSCGTSEGKDTSGSETPTISPESSGSSV